jgi:hypothetical protein
MYSITQSINWARTFIQYVPLTAGTGSEPAFSTGTMIRNSILNVGIYPWNRNEDSSTSTVVNTPDYTVALTDFGFLEKASVTDDQGNIYEIKDILNTAPLASTNSQPGRPNAICVITNIPYTSVKIRLFPCPDKIYTVTLTYQKISVPFQSFNITSVATSSGGNAVYTGTFTGASLPVGTSTLVAGFVATPANNGTFKVVSVTPTTLTLNNASAVAETHAATVTNPNWDPIPDSYMDVYNNLFLAEMFTVADDNRVMTYRQRGVAAMLAKAEGLSETQKNIFAQQWLARNSESVFKSLQTQLGSQSKGI